MSITLRGYQIMATQRKDDGLTTVSTVYRATDAPKGWLSSSSVLKT